MFNKKKQKAVVNWNCINLVHQWHLSCLNGKNVCINEKLLSNFLEKIEQIQATFAEFCSNFLEILDQLVAEAN